MCVSIYTFVLFLALIIIIIIIDNHAASVYLFESCYVCFNIYFCSLHFCTVAGEAFRKQGRKQGRKGDGERERERERERRVFLLLCVRNSRRIYFEHQKWESLKIWEEDLGEEIHSDSSKARNNISFWR
jgi:hypothetical protein